MSLVVTSQTPEGRNLYRTNIVNEEVFVESNGFIEVVTIDNRNFARTVYHIYNSGANSLDYTFHGHVDPNNGLPPNFNATWKQIIEVPVTLPPNTPQVETLTDKYSWIRLSMKRTVTDQDTKAQLWINAHGS